MKIRIYMRPKFKEYLASLPVQLPAIMAPARQPGVSFDVLRMNKKIVGYCLGLGRLTIHVAKEGRHSKSRRSRAEVLEENLAYNYSQLSEEQRELVDMDKKLRHAEYKRASECRMKSAK